MKKTVGVLSLFVMLLSQVFTPFAYAVSGEEVSIQEPVVEEIISELEVLETVVIPEVDNSTGDNNLEIDETNTREVVVEPVDVEVNTGTTVITGEEIKNLKEEELTGTEASSGFIEIITESIKDFLGINGEDDESFESNEIYGTGEYEGVKVEVYAQTGLFVSGTELTIEPVVEEKLEAVQHVLLSGEVDFVKEQVIAFDITFRDPITQEELQPKDGTVQVKFNYEDNESLVQAEEDEEQEVKVYHLNDMDEEGNKIEELTGTTVEEVMVNEEESEEENVMVVEAESFSVYTIVVQVAEEGPLATENQLANFVYGEISINRPSILDSTVYPIEGFTIMDRNLGAISNDRVSTGSYGYHYQWGNNYGFEQKCWTDNCTDSVTSNAKDVTVSGATFIGSVMNNSGYKGTIFIKDGSNKSYDYWKNGDNYSHYDALWGGSGDINYESTKNNITKLYWDDGNDRSLRQGPCPEGWHVPSAGEWSMLFYYWYNSGAIDVQTPDVSRNLYYSYDKTTLNQFLKDFKIPIAGLRNYGGANINPYHAQLWSSSPESTNSKNARTLATMSSYIGTDYKYPRGNGLHVRCFKNTYSGAGDFHTITFEYNGGKGSTASINVLSGGTGEIPSNPVKLGYTFLGWYETGSNIPFDFTGTIITGDITLYAKYGKTATLLPGKEFNAAVKNLAQSISYAAYNLTDTSMTGFMKSYNEPLDAVQTGIISTSDSPVPVIAWFDNGIIYYYSNADVIYMNPDSSYLFTYAEALQNVDFNDFNMSRVESLDHAFDSCYNLRTADLGNFKGNNLVSAEYMFMWCSNLESIDLGNFVGTNLVNAKYMFGSCPSLESIDLGNFVGTNLVYMDGMFSRCTNLKMINIYKFNSEYILSLYDTFYNDPELKTIYVGNDFDVSNVPINKSSAFVSSSSLVGGNGTKYDSIKTDKTYAKIDGGISNPGYFTDPSHFAIRIKNMNDEEILTQWISTGGKAQELKGNQSNYTYYVDKERTAEFNFNTPLYSYTEIYVDGISLLNEITIGTNNSAYGSVNTNILSAKYGEKITLSGNELIIGDNSILATPTESDNEFTYYFNGWDTTCGEGSNLTYYDEIIYKHDGDYYFDGTNYINTEAELFNTENYRKDFKLSFNIVSYNSSETVEQGSFMSIMDETGRPRPGMVFRKKDGDGSSLEFTANGGEGNQYFYTASTTKKVKISRNNSKIYIQLNDENNADMYDYTNFNSFFNVPLTIGSSLDGSLNPWRYVKGTLSGIELILVNTGVSNGDEIIGNCSLTANFSRVKKSYPVIFKNEDGTELNKKTLEYGTIPQYGLSTPTKASDTYYDYTFSGWNHQFSEVSGPQVYTATYNQSYKKYKITWKDGDNKILKEDLVSYDSEPSYNGNIPTKTSTLQTGYTFNGTWNPSIHKVTGEETYVAQFSETLNKYVITFLNEDNSFLSSGEYSYGTVADSINQPSAIKSSDGTYDYIFDNWIPELKTVTGDQTYKASYNSEYIDYTINFVDEDGMLLSGTTYHSGDTVILPDDPEKAADAQYTYSFNGWIPAVGIVTGDMTYTATYIGTINSYTITFINDDETVIETKQVEYGTTSGDYKPASNPTKLGHTFDKWFPDLVTVTTGATYKATYTPNKYLLTIEFGTGVESVAGEGFYDYDTEAIITGMAKQGYHFEGGERTGVFIFKIPANDFTEVISAIPNTYMVRFQENDGVGTMEDQEFTYDLTGELKANGFKKNGHLFAGWISEKGMYYPNKGKVYNLATGGIVNFMALWIEGGNNSDSNPLGAAGGGRIIEQNNKVEDHEHKAADEKHDETVEEQIKTPEKTNTTSSQSSTQQSSSSSKEITVTVDPEIQSAYEWAYERDVTTIPSLDEAMPDGVVTRGHLAKMVVNYATNVLGREIPEKIPSECRWSDWRKDRESEEIKDYAVKSCALGLMGLDMPKFLPNMQVTRAQFGTIMSRLLWGKKYAGGTPYYRKHLNALKENGIMTQIENPERRVELRQWVWLMLMRSAQNK